MTRRAAIVGHNWGVRMPLEALRTAGWTVDLLVGRSDERTEAAARLHSIPNWTCDVTRAFNGSYDLVAVAVPWLVHSDFVQLAIQTRTPILIEHPLGASAEESEILASRAEQEGIPLFVNLPTRFLEPVGELLHTAAISPGSWSVAHRFDYPDDEERDWLPLLLTHSLDLANFCFGRPAIRETTIADVKILRTELCPGWSWPLRGANSPPSSMVSAKRIELAGTIGHGSYCLSIGHSEEQDFIETVGATWDSVKMAYETRLHRIDEHSPWHASKLWRGAPSEVPVFNDKPKHDGIDVWLECHVAQLKAITDQLEGRPPTRRPAIASDAALVHRTIEGAIDRAKS